jgi:hypothetical protein
MLRCVQIVIELHIVLNFILQQISRDSYYLENVHCTVRF